MDRVPAAYFKKLVNTEGIWEARAGDSLRITFEMRGDLLILRMVGPHDAALKNP